MRPIRYLVVHCADSPLNCTVEHVREWHTAPPPRGRGWSDIGYHAVIHADGSVHAGRPEERPGAHVKGHNRDSLAVCLIGGHHGHDDFTVAQQAALVTHLRACLARFPGARVVGHCELAPESGKTCPVISMDAVRALCATEVG